MPIIQMNSENKWTLAVVAAIAWAFLLNKLSQKLYNM